MVDFSFSLLILSIEQSCFWSRIRLATDLSVLLCFQRTSSWVYQVPHFFSFFLCFLFYPSLLPLWASQVALVVKNLPANAGDIRDAGLILGGGHGNPLPYSCLEDPMDPMDPGTIVHRVAKSQT